MMKYTLLLIVGLTLSFYAFPQKTKALLKPDTSNEIVFLGNSITSVGKWQTLIPNKTVINKGLSGDLTKGILSRLPKIISKKPGKIFIMIGVNDIKIGTAIPSITANCRKMIQMIKAESPGTTIYMQSVLPVNQPMLAAIYKRLNNIEIYKLNKQLKKICRNNRVKYINLHPIMRDGAGQLKAELSTDGLHLKPEAYVMWVNFLHSKKYL